MIEGLSHITFIVRDLNRMASFLKSVFDAQEVYSSGDNTFSHSRERFFLISGIWIAAMEGEPLENPTYNHIAFKINESDFELYESRVRAAGVEIKPSRPRVSGEGRSLYFYDFDNHLFELHTGTLSERLTSYNGKE
jgi:catechol 2,3-dioxygenase-like lactoylglutathione lyase family enzyme